MEFLLPLSGVLDGVGSELGGSALVIVIAKIIHEIIRERKSRATAEKVVDGGGSGKENTQSRNRPLNPGRRNGNSSTDLMLHILQEHTKQIEQANREINEVKNDLSEVKVSIARIEGRLNQGGK